MSANGRSLNTFLFKDVRLKLSVVLFISSLQLNAQQYAGPTSTALGGTGRANFDNSESLFINPATLVLAPAMSVNLYYQEGESLADYHSTSMGLSAVDNSPDILVPGGLAYVKGRDHFSGSSPIEFELFHLGVAGYFYKTMSLGLSLYQLTKNSDSGASSTQYNGSLGYLFYHGSFFYGLVYDNLIQTAASVPVEHREVSKVSIGFQYLWGKLMAYRLDIQKPTEDNPEGKSITMIGLNSLSGDWFHFRAGYRIDDIIGKNYWSLGFLFDGPRLKMDYALKKQLDSAAGALHSVDFRFSF